MVEGEYRHHFGDWRNNKYEANAYTGNGDPRKGKEEFRQIARWPDPRPCFLFPNDEEDRKRYQKMKVSAIFTNIDIRL